MSSMKKIVTSCGYLCGIVLGSRAGATDISTLTLDKYDLVIYVQFEDLHYNYMGRIRYTRFQRAYFGLSDIMEIGKGSILMKANSAWNESIYYSRR